MGVVLVHYTKRRCDAADGARWESGGQEGLYGMDKAIDLGRNGHNANVLKRPFVAHTMRSAVLCSCATRVFLFTDDPCASVIHVLHLVG